MTTSQEKLPEKSTSEEASVIPVTKPVNLAWRSTWLDERAYNAVGNDSEPLKRGLYALLVALLIAAVSRLIGVGLGLLTAPRIGVIQDQIYGAFTSTGFYANLVQRSPDFADQFSRGYVALWDLIRLFGGYPSYAGLGSSLINLLLMLASWFVFTSLTYVVARWLGARTDYDRALGVFALAYTPVMLTVVKMIPGASVAWTLIFLLILVAKFLAAREVYELTPGSSLAVIFLPYVIGLIVILGLLIFGAALGLNQIPYLDELLRTLRFASIFGG